MLENYFKTAVRNILRNKSFSFITLLGLASGLTCALLILVFVVDELSYDKFHDQYKQIFRMRYKIQNYDLSTMPPVIRENLGDYFSEMRHTARIYNRSVSVKVSNNAKIERYEASNANCADPEIFEIFDFERVQGTLKNALQRPFTVILNEEIARKYFNKSNPIGQSIMLEGDKSFMVTAVVKDFPSNSHRHFDMLIPYDNMYDLEPDYLKENIRNNFRQNWMVSHSTTYVLLNEDADIASINDRLQDFINEKIPVNQNKGQIYELQPLADIHLNDDVQDDEQAGSWSFLYIFIAVGLLTLLIACINFINLSTARSLERTKEISMRRALGAWKSNLMAQFLGESVISTILAAFVALWFAGMLLPQFNILTGKELTINDLFQIEIVIGFTLIIILTGILSGLYPSFFVTSMPTITAIQGMDAKKVSGKLSFRRGLMVVQFIISIMLITSAFIVFDQLDFLRNKPLGFNKDLLVTVPVQSQNLNNAFGGVDEKMRNKLNAFEETLHEIPGVKASTLSSTLPGLGVVSRNIIPEGFTAEDNMLSPVMAVDYDFIETYEIDLITGRSFSHEYGSDHLDAFILNETAVKEFYFQSPEEALGKSINLEGKEGKVIGVVKDFNYISLAQALGPLIMEVSTPQFSVFSIRLENHNISETIAEVEAAWNEFFPEETFDFNFLDESLAQNYDNQEKIGKLISYFAIIAIIISCMGSYGLIMFVATQKTKEFGIRKVLGASITNLVMLLGKRFMVLVMVSLVISIPITIYAANLWLEDFSYRTEFQPMNFVFASIITIALVGITISYQSIKAALANPVEALRSE